MPTLLQPTRSSSEDDDRPVMKLMHYLTTATCDRVDSFVTEDILTVGAIKQMTFEADPSKQIVEQLIMSYLRRGQEVLPNSGSYESRDNPLSLRAVSMHVEAQFAYCFYLAVPGQQRADGGPPGWVYFRQNATMAEVMEAASTLQGHSPSKEPVTAWLRFRLRPPMYAKSRNVDDYAMLHKLYRTPITLRYLYNQVLNDLPLPASACRSQDGKVSRLALLALFAWISSPLRMRQYVERFPTNGNDTISSNDSFCANTELKPSFETSVMLEKDVYLALFERAKKGTARVLPVGLLKELETVKTEVFLTFLDFKVVNGGKNKSIDFMLQFLSEALDKDGFVKIQTETYRACLRKSSDCNDGGMSVFVDCNSCTVVPVLVFKHPGQHAVELSLAVIETISVTPWGRVTSMVSAHSDTSSDTYEKGDGVVGSSKKPLKKKVKDFVRRFGRSRILSEGGDSVVESTTSTTTSIQSTKPHSPTIQSDDDITPTGSPKGNGSLISGGALQVALEAQSQICENQDLLYIVRFQTVAPDQFLDPMNILENGILIKGRSMMLSFVSCVELYLRACVRWTLVNACDEAYSPLARDCQQYKCFGMNGDFKSEHLQETGHYMIRMSSRTIGDYVLTYLESRDEEHGGDCFHDVDLKMTVDGRHEFDGHVTDERGLAGIMMMLAEALKMNDSSKTPLRAKSERPSINLIEKSALHSMFVGDVARRKVYRDCSAIFVATSLVSVAGISFLAASEFSRRHGDGEPLNCFESSKVKRISKLQTVYVARHRRSYVARVLTESALDAVAKYSAAINDNQSSECESQITVESHNDQADAVSAFYDAAFRFATQINSRPRGLARCVAVSFAKQCYLLSSPRCRWNLSFFLRKLIDGSVSLRAVVALFVELVVAVRAIHSAGLSHGQISCDSVLLSRSKHYVDLDESVEEGQLVPPERAGTGTYTYFAQDCNDLSLLFSDIVKASQKSYAARCTLRQSRSTEGCPLHECMKGLDKNSFDAVSEACERIDQVVEELATYSGANDSEPVAVGTAHFRQMNEWVERLRSSLETIKNAPLELRFIQRCPKDFKIDEMDARDFTMIESLGYGHFSVVYSYAFSGDIPPVKGDREEKMEKVAIALSKKKVAIKFFRSDRPDEIFKKEIDAMRKVSMRPHDHLVLLLGTCNLQAPEKEARKFSDRQLVMEYVDGGTLADFVTQSQSANRYRIKHCLTAFKQLSSALDYLANCNFVDKNLGDQAIVHGDVAIRNVLLVNDVLKDPKAIMHVKLCDFGLAHFLSQGSTYSSAHSKYQSPPFEMALEVFQRRCYSAMSDIYSFGTLIWKVWAHTNDDPQSFKSTTARYRELMKSPPRADEHLLRKPDCVYVLPMPSELFGGEVCAVNNTTIASLVRECVDEDPHRRPTADVLEKTFKEMLQNYIRTSKPDDYK